MRITLAELEGRRFDVVVIGGGINGASSAQHLAAAGYRVLLVDKGDFGSGSSARSTRLLHCGLRYFETPRPLRDFLFHPGRLRTALTMARASMETRAELVTDSAARLARFTLCFPIYRGGSYRPWHLDLGFKLLAALGPKTVPLDYRRLPAREARRLPLVDQLAEPERLHSVATFREYLIDWPERFCLDALLDAERLGAVVRNYTQAWLIRRDDQGRWHVGLSDGEARATVFAPVVVNTAGIWIDQVNRTAETGARPKRLILGTKGAHIVVRLPAAYRDFGIATLNSLGEPHYCLPSQGDYHHIGPTETLYEGDLDDIRVTQDERAFLLAETNAVLPGLGLSEADVVYSWAGVRPLTYDPAFPKGLRSRQIHDLSGQGLTKVLALTAGPVMSHRSAGREMTAAVGRHLAPSRPPQAPDYRPRQLPEDSNAPPFIPGDERLRLSHLGHLATTEHGLTLADILISRCGLAYRHQLNDETLRRAAGGPGRPSGLGPSRDRAPGRRRPRPPCHGLPAGQGKLIWHYHLSTSVNPNSDPCLADPPTRPPSAPPRTPGAC